MKFFNSKKSKTENKSLYPTIKNSKLSNRFSYQLNNRKINIAEKSLEIMRILIAARALNQYEELERELNYL